MTVFFRLVMRDLQLAARQGGALALSLGFFALAAALFPFALGPDPELLSLMAAGIVWVSALLAALLSLERLFQLDYDDGSLELLATLPLPLEMVVLAKTVAHWLGTAVPLILLAPLLAVALNLPSGGLLGLVAALFLGTPALSLLGALGAALTVGVRRGGVLVPLLVLPLLIPTLIFGVGASVAGGTGMAGEAPFLLLGALSLLALVIAPVAGGAALRLVLE